MSALSDTAKARPSFAQSLAARFVDWAVNSYGSSRSSGLLRIGIALLTVNLIFAITVLTLLRAAGP